MWGRLFELSADEGRPLQSQIRQMMVAAILDRQLVQGSPVPSTRELAERLGVARNTVMLAYQQLVDEGFLTPRERSGYYVSKEAVSGWASGTIRSISDDGTHPDWLQRFAVRPSRQRNITKPQDWQRFRYPFLYGQFDPMLFPIADWRECCRQALGVLEVRDWAPDLIDGDDPLLIEQLRTHVLPRRGIWATTQEIMVTIGAQQGLFLLAELLVRDDRVVGIEDPGYPDARNIFSLKTARVRPLPIDERGVLPDGIEGCDYAYITPSHQCPTTVTLPLERRRALLELAAARDVVLIEDDYESEVSYVDRPTPALKSLDTMQRVIYVGSLSKTLAPGLRLGYIVGPAELIREARALRRLMLRHPPANNQRAAALFLSLGHHEALVRRLTHVLKDRSLALRRALDRHLPELEKSNSIGGSSYWLKGPQSLDAVALAERARRRGVLIEPGGVFFMAEAPPRNFFRLGFSSIPAERIDAGIAELAALVRADALT